MINNDQLFKYLQSKIPGFIKTTSAGAILFTCPDTHKHSYKVPSASFIPGTDKIQCLRCGFTGTIYDAIRTVEPEKAKMSDAEITNYLIEALDLNMYKELDAYKKYGWSLVPLLKNSNKPFETDWRNKDYFDKIRWIKWLNNDLNVGLNCEKSKVMAIDIDTKPVTDETAKKNREELIELLKPIDTLKANTPHGGTHYVFLWEEEIRHQEVNLAGTQIDTRTEGQIAIAPSIRDGVSYQWVNLGVEIKQMPKEVKEKILALMKVEKSIELPKAEDLNIDNGKILTLSEGEGRNNLLTSLGGAFINKFNTEDTAYILSMINKNFFKPQLPEFEIKATLASLTGYKESDEATQETKIYNHMKMIQSDITARDLMESLKLPRAIIEKWLSVFVKDGRAIRMGRGRYQYKEKVEWSDQTPELVDEYMYKIPLFNNVAIFQDKDVILLGARTNDGKTTIALNMLRDVILQGAKPFYIYSEAGSRFQKTSQRLGIAGKYYHTYHENPLAIELEYHAFSIIDWLHLEHKENTDTVLKHLNDELQRKGGILVIFTQLKQTYEFFAPNLIDHYPTFAARYMQDNDTKTAGHWDISKIKEPRGDSVTYNLACEYDLESKIFKVKEII